MNYQLPIRHTQDQTALRDTFTRGVVEIEPEKIISICG